MADHLEASGAMHDESSFVWGRQSLRLSKEPISSTHLNPRSCLYGWSPASLGDRGFTQDHELTSWELKQNEKKYETTDSLRLPGPGDSASLDGLLHLLHRGQTSIVVRALMGLDGLPRITPAAKSTLMATRNDIHV